MEKYNLKQKKVAELLGLTQAAISQYNRKSRGFEIRILEKDPKIIRMIEDLTKDISLGKIGAKKIQSRFCEICKTIRKKRLICDMHEDIYPT